MIGVYKITSPSGKIYIGSSIDIEKRIKYYSSSNCKGQRRLYNSIIKYGWTNHLFEILEECELDILHKRERYYGKLFDTVGAKGLNLLLPTSTDDAYIGVSKETRINMSNSKLGSKNSFYMKKHSKKTKQKIRECQIGRKHSIEHRQKVSLNSAKTKAKLVLDLYTGVYYESAKEAAFYNNIKHSTLKSQLNNTNKLKTTHLIYA